MEIKTSQNLQCRVKQDQQPKVLAGREKERTWESVRGKNEDQSRTENRLKEENLDSEVESDLVRRFLMLLVIVEINMNILEVIRGQKIGAEIDCWSLVTFLVVLLFVLQSLISTSTVSCYTVNSLRAETVVFSLLHLVQHFAYIWCSVVCNELNYSSQELCY